MKPILMQTYFIVPAQQDRHYENPLLIIILLLPVLSSLGTNEQWLPLYPCVSHKRKQAT